jgi:hypothetical protein
MSDTLVDLILADTAWTVRVVTAAVAAEHELSRIKDVSQNGHQITARYMLSEALSPEGARA